MPALRGKAEGQHCADRDAVLGEPALVRLERVPVRFRGWIGHERIARSEHSHINDVLDRAVLADVSDAERDQGVQHPEADPTSLVEDKQHAAVRRQRGTVHQTLLLLLTRGRQLELKARRAGYLGLSVRLNGTIL